jgi:hypothetical protein
VLSVSTDIKLADDGIAAMMRAKSDRKFLARQLDLKLTGLHTVSNLVYPYCTAHEDAVVVYKMC